MVQNQSIWEKPRAGVNGGSTPITHCERSAVPVTLHILAQPGDSTAVSPKYGVTALIVTGS